LTISLIILQDLALSSYTLNIPWSSHQSPANHKCMAVLKVVFASHLDRWNSDWLLWSSWRAAARDREKIF